MKILHQKIRFLDNTLRDGEQTPGVMFNNENKTKLVSVLADIGIEAAEVGFPAVSDEERLSIKSIVKLGLDIDITVLCRPIRKDIDYAYECGVKSVRVLFPKSKKYIEQLGLNPSNLESEIIKIVEYAFSMGFRVRVIYEDAARTSQEDIISIFSKLANIGVYTLGFADTSGIMTPFDTFARIKEIVKEVNCPIGIHCHNDLGLATANTLAALEAGATEIESCVNGIGERAGNAAFEEIAVLLHQHYHTNLSINFALLDNLSKLVSQYSGLLVSPQKPIVGSNAFLHESGIHANSIIHGEKIYQAFDPALIQRRHEISIGKHSSLLSIQHFLYQNGINFLPSEQKNLLSYIKQQLSANRDIDVIVDDFIKRSNSEC